MLCDDPEEWDEGEASKKRGVFKKCLPSEKKSEKVTQKLHQVK